MSIIDHPLHGFSMNIRGIKCFDETGSGFFQFSPITFIIGKNNSGKSTILDVLDQCCADGRPMFQEPFMRTETQPYIEIRSEVDENRLKREFPDHVSGGSIPDNHWNYATEKILPFTFTWEFNREREARIIGDGQISKELVPEASSRLAKCKRFPFDDLWSTRIRAERDVQPEQRNTNRELGSTGNGLTNLIRAFINSQDLPRDLVEVDLLNDLNEIYLGDNEFSEIICQEDERSGNWEIFLREDGKGDIRLSQSGSSLRTVFLVLAFLRLYPKVADTGSEKNLVFCVEEPENNLHPAQLRRLIDFLATQRTMQGFSLVITTHSPICIDLATKRDDATLLHVRKDVGRTICGNVLDYAGQSDILEDLDVRGSDILQSNGIIWVEGPSDRIYLKKWIEIISKGKLREGAHYTFMFYGGKILSHFDALPPQERSEKIAMLAVNRNMAIVMDSDRRPKASRTKSGRVRKPSMRLNETKKEIIRQVEAIDGFVWVTAGKEVENYIPKSVWEKVAGRSVKILDEYEDVPSLQELEKLSATKVDLAHRAEKLIDYESIQSHLDLESRVTQLCQHIQKWNALD